MKSTTLFKYLTVLLLIPLATAYTGITWDFSTGQVTLNNTILTGTKLSCNDIIDNTSDVCSGSGGGGGNFTSFDISNGTITNTVTNGDTIQYVAGTNMYITQTGNTLTFTSTANGTPTSYTNGTGINLTGSTFSLAPNGVTQGTFGNSTHTTQITPDQYGRITTITNTAINILRSAISDLSSIAGTGLIYTSGVLSVNIGSQNATAAQTGYLRSIDFEQFSHAGSSNLTSVGITRSGTTSFNITNTPLTSNGNIDISFTNASTSQSGILRSIDFEQFSHAGSSNLTATLTSGQFTYATNTTNIDSTPTLTRVNSSDVKINNTLQTVDGGFMRSNSSCAFLFYNSTGGLKGAICG